MRITTKQFGILAFQFLLGSLLTGVAWADPLPGEILKFQQQPMINTTITDPTGVTNQYFGHDELSTAWNYPTDPTGIYRGTFMADDFADTFSTPVVHVSWWGSYMNVNAANPPQQVQKFLIAFESDVPADPTNPNSWSYPGAVLNSQIVSLTTSPLTPQSGNFTEKAVPGSNPAETVYKYNAELSLPFGQLKDTVYWLKIVALDDVVGGAVPLQWGWHNRDYTLTNPLASPLVAPGETLLDPSLPLWHFQDDAVQGHIDVAVNSVGPININQFYAIPGDGPKNYVPSLDGPSYVGQYSKDLAFELYTVPEPATLTLLGMGVVGLSAYMCRKRRSARMLTAD